MAEGGEVRCTSDKESELSCKLSKEVGSPLEQIGSLDVRRTVTGRLQGPMKPDFVLRGKYKGIEKYKVRGKERWACGITSCVCVSDNRLLLSDFTNDKLKLINAKWAIQYFLKLDSRPWDLASISEREAIVTLPHIRKLQFIAVNDKLKLGKRIKVFKKCWGVDYRNDKLYVVCAEVGEGEIQVLDMKGQCLSRFTGSNGITKFQYPRYIAVDENERLYVSDRRTDTLTCLNKTGKTVYSYTDSELKYPLGVIVDGKQNAYVCGQNSNNIQIIDARGNKVETLLEQKDGIRNPWVIAYKAKENAVVVGADVGNEISVYYY